MWLWATWHNPRVDEPADRPSASLPWAKGACDADGVTISYWRTGGAQPPIVLLHGLIGSGACWAPVARDLEGEFDVVMPDARGHGDSSAPASGYRYEDHARDVAHLLAGLDLARPVLVGHSMGGMIAAIVASRAPRLLRALVLVDPTFLDPERQREVHASDVAGQHRALLRVDQATMIAQARERSRHRSAALVALQVEARRKTHLGAFDLLTPPAPDYRDVVRAIAVPTLLVIGDRDPVVTPALAAELCALNPRIRVEQIRDAGHGLPFDQPAALAQRVAAFARAPT